MIPWVVVSEDADGGLDAIELDECDKLDASVVRASMIQALVAFGASASLPALAVIGVLSLWPPFLGCTTRSAVLARREHRERARTSLSHASHR